jgi:hypothetical protein
MKKPKTCLESNEEAQQMMLISDVAYIPMIVIVTTINSSDDTEAM